MGGGEKDAGCIAEFRNRRLVGTWIPVIANGKTYYILVVGFKLTHYLHSGRRIAL